MCVARVGSLVMAQTLLCLYGSNSVLLSLLGSCCMVVDALLKSVATAVRIATLNSGCPTENPICDTVRGN